MVKTGFLAAQTAIDGDSDLFNLVAITNREDNNHYEKLGIETSDARRFNHILNNSIDTTHADYVIFEIYASESGAGPGRILKQKTRIARTKVYLDYLSIVNVYANRRLEMSENLTLLGL